MGRGPSITNEEVKRAHELKNLEPKIIAERLGRSLPTIYKMLAMTPQQEEANKVNEHP